MKGEQERRGGRECQSAICSCQASDSRKFRGAGHGAPQGGWASGAQGQRIVQRGFANLMYSASSRDGALCKRERGDEERACCMLQERRDGRECQSAIWQLRGAFAHAHYRFQKSTLLVLFWCDFRVKGTIMGRLVL